MVCEIIKMGEGSKYRKEIEKPLDGGMPAGFLEEVVVRQSVESPSPPPPGLGPEYREEIKKHFEKLVFSKGKIGEILKAKGLELAPRHFKDVPEKIREVLDECVNYLADELVGKYGRENIEDIILKEEFGNLPEIQMEAEKSVFAYFGDTLEDQLTKAKSAEEREWIENQLKKLEPIKKELGIAHDVQLEGEQGEVNVNASKKTERKIAPKRSEKETRDLVFKFVDRSAEEKRKKMIATIEEMEKLMREIGEGKKELVPADPEDKAAVGIIEHSLRVIKIDDGDYLKAFQELKDPKNYIRKMREELAEAYKDEDLKKRELEESIFYSVTGRFDQIAHQNSIAEEMFYLANDIKRGRIIIADKKEESNSFISELKEKRRKQTEEIVTKNFDEIVAKDIDNMLARWSEGKNLTAEDIAKIKRNCALDKENIINNIVESIFEGNERLRMPLGTNAETLSFLGMRDKILEYARRYVEEKAEEEKSFSPEQLVELRDLIAATREFRNKVERPELQEIVGDIIREDLVSGGVFSEEEVSDAVEYVMRWIDKFNDKK